jgi:hypothetical protein
MFTTILFAILLMTFGTILSASMQQQRAMAFASSSSSITETDSFSQSEQCEESGPGINSASCFDVIFPSSFLGTSVSESAPVTANAIGSGEITLTLTGDQQIECNESGPGDNNAGCINVGQFNDFVSQTITGTASDNGNVKQDNNAELVQTMTQQIHCNESGPGDNNAGCLDDASNSITLFQDSTATASDNANIEQGNNANVAQTIEQQIKCDEAGAGDNNAVCQNQATNNIDSISQSSTATASDNSNIEQGNSGDVVQTIHQQLQCDETSAGDNGAICANNTVNSLESLSQTNTATALGNGNFIQNNNAKVIQTVDQQNKCDESGPGDNLAFCQPENVITNTISAISQTNTASGDGVLEQGNNANVVQTVDQKSKCDESGEGNSGALCLSIADNRISNPISQTNTATASGNGNIDQDNKAEVIQVADQQLQCDEADAGDNNAFCGNIADNFVDSISQTNTAAGDGIFDQGNDAAVSQTTKQQNKCDESGQGGSVGFILCDNVADNSIGSRFGITSNPLTQQTNTAAGDGIFDQGNNANVVQTADQQNSCNESGEGNNNGAFVACSNFVGNSVGTSDSFNPISQTNTAAGDGIFDQVNGLKILQIGQQQNSCNESGEGNNVPACFNEDASSVDSITQTNTAAGDGIFDQGNNANVVQTADQQNSCNESGEGNNDVFCQNLAVNLIGLDFISNSLAQTNTASGDGIFDQGNDAGVSQTTKQQNKCDESGQGSNFAFCGNFAVNQIGFGFFSNPLVQTNDASGNGNFIQNNNAKVIQTVDQQNKCDESDSGDNNAVCVNFASNGVDSITQTNTASGDGIFDQGNNANVVQTAKQQNNCSQSGPGDNNAFCENTATNTIGPITQTNDAARDGSFAQNNDLKISQIADQQNKCGNLGFGDNNAATCQNTAISTVGPVSQTDGQSLDINQNTDQNNHCNIDSACSNTATEDVEGINSGTVSQDVTQDNNCLFESSCSNTASATVADDGGTNNGNANANQEIDQSNLCMFNSNCVNDASATDSSSNAQSNMCFFDSNCENTGVNDNTLCIAGSNCSNSGTDSRLIGVAADDCSATGTGTTICVGSLRVDGNGGVSGFDIAGSAPTTSTATPTRSIQPISTSSTPTTTTIPAAATTTAGDSTTTPTTTTAPTATTIMNIDSLQNIVASSDSASGLVSQQQQQQEEQQQPRVERSDLQQTPLSTTSTTDNNVNTNNENDDSKLTTALNDNTSPTSSSTTSTSTSSSSPTDSSSDGNQALTSDKSNDGLTTTITTGRQGATNDDVKSNDKQEQEQHVATSSDIKTSDGNSNNANAGASNVDDSNSDRSGGGASDNAGNKKVHDDSGTNKKAAASNDHGSNTSTENKKVHDDVKKDDTSTKKGDDNTSDGGSEKHQKGDRTNKHDSIKEEKNDS